MKTITLSEALDKLSKKLKGGYMTVKVEATLYHDGSRITKWGVYSDKLGTWAKGDTFVNALEKLLSSTPIQDVEVEAEKPKVDVKP